MEKQPSDKRSVADKDREAIEYLKKANPNFDIETFLASNEPDEGDTGPEKEPHTLLDHLINQAVEKFWAKDRYVYRNHYEPYGIVGASNDTVEDFIKENELPPIYAAMYLSTESKFTPNQVYLLETAHETESWDEYYINISTYIVTTELKDRHKDIALESIKRFNKIDPLTAIDMT